MENFELTLEEKKRLNNHIKKLIKKIVKENNDDVLEYDNEQIKIINETLLNEIISKKNSIYKTKVLSMFQQDKVIFFIDQNLVKIKNNNKTWKNAIKKDGEIMEEIIENYFLINPDFIFYRHDLGQKILKDERISRRNKILDNLYSNEFPTAFSSTLKKGDKKIMSIVNKIKTKMRKDAKDGMEVYPGYIIQGDLTKQTPNVDSELQSGWQYTEFNKKIYEACFKSGKSGALRVLANLAYLKNKGLLKDERLDNIHAIVEWLEEEIRKEKPTSLNKTNKKELEDFSNN